MIYRANLSVLPRPPFDFDLSTAIFSLSDMEERDFEKGSYLQALRAGGNLVLISVGSKGTVDKPDLLVGITSEHKITPQTETDVRELVNLIFNLKLDLSPFYETAKNDPLLVKFTRKLRGLKSPSTPTVFEALVDSIIEQQISLAAAHAITGRLIETFGDTFNFNKKKYYEFPTPERLSTADIADFRKCGLSLKKSGYIRNIAGLISEGRLDLEKFKKYDDNGRILKEMDALPGIGVWTAELTMLRAMQKFDAMPADDLGLKRIISHFYFKDRRISSGETRALAERWGRWKGLAAFYLIVAEMKGLKP
jgi:DNA-3-methyladenine glycosylase II